MQSRITISCLIASLAALSFCFGSTKNNSEPVDYFLYGDMIYTDNIGAVLFHPMGNQLASPRILLNSNDKLELRFDDFDADFKNYYYTIIHCDAHWNPSNILKSEYIEGFQEETIRSYARSINTAVQFTQYSLIFPSMEMSPRLSGNYILKVYLHGNPENLVFTRRFMVFEPNVMIEGKARQSLLPQYYDTHQQVNFSVNLGRYQVSNPTHELKVVVTQNGRWDNAIININPRMILGSQLVFDHEHELLFEGGNVFRRFDIRSLKAGSEFVSDIVYSSRYWEVFLRDDVNRSLQGYVLADHINGRFLIKNYDYNDDHLEGDYAWVYFNLPFHEPLENASIHVIGALTDWAPTEYNRLTYNFRQRSYQASFLLKQGYYNYQYAVLQDGQHTASVAQVEGNHSVTRNEYQIHVYHRRPGDFYDRLIGMSQISTP